MNNKEYVNDVASDDPDMFQKSYKDNIIWRIISSMQTVIILVFLAVFTVFLMLFAMWSASFYTAIRNLSWDLQEASIQYLVKTVESEIKTHSNIVDTIGIAVEYENSFVFDRNKLRSYATNMFTSTATNRPEFNSLRIVDHIHPSMISIARDDSNYTNAGLDLYTIFESFDQADPQDGTLYYYSDETFTSVIDSEPHTEDFMNSAWAETATSTEKPLMKWTPTFIFNSPQYGYGNHSVTSIVRMVYDGTNNLKYSIASSMTNLRLQTELNNVVGSGSNGIALVFDTLSGDLVAITDERSESVFNETRVNLSQLKPREVKKIVSYVKKTFKPQTLENAEIKSGWYHDGPKGAQYLVSISRVIRPEGLDWTIVYGLNRNKLIFKPMVTFVACSIISGIAVVLGIMGGVYTSKRLTGPVKELQQEMQKIETMSLDRINELEESQFSELRSIQRSFQIIVDKLKEYRSAIPQKLLKELDGIPESPEDVDQQAVVDSGNND